MLIKRMGAMPSARAALSAHAAHAARVAPMGRFCPSTGSMNQRSAIGGNACRRSCVRGHELPSRCPLYRYALHGGTACAPWHATTQAADSGR